MRIVFFGTPQIAVPALAALAERHEVAAVVCQPDRPKGRGQALQPPPVKVWALEHGIEAVQPEKLNDGAFESWLRDRAPEVCALAAYGRLLKQPILDIPPHGFVNMHPSLLPKYRGPSPIQSALLHGETKTGVTIIRLTLDMDAGDVLLQEELDIAPEDNAIQLAESLAQLGGAMMARALELIESGKAVYTPQDHTQATYCGLFEKKDGAIRWADSARAIHNRVRAAAGWPVAYCQFKGDVFRIHETGVVDEPPHAAPGTVVLADKRRVLVASGEGLVSLKVVQTPGKKAMPIDEFLRGTPISAGDRFEDI